MSSITDIDPTSALFDACNRPYQKQDAKRPATSQMRNTPRPTYQLLIERIGALRSETKKILLHHQRDAFNLVKISSPSRIPHRDTTSGAIL